MGFKGDLDIRRDVERMTRQDVAALSAGARKASKQGVAAFDQYAQTQTTTHPPMRATVRPVRGGYVLSFAVSPRVPTYKYITVHPSLTTNTTGRNRQLVTVTGWRGHTVSVPRGFIWDGIILMRKSETDRKLTSARDYLISQGALPTPAEILARCVGSVYLAVDDAIGAEFVQGVSYVAA